MCVKNDNEYRALKRASDVQNQVSMNMFFWYLSLVCIVRRVVAAARTSGVEGRSRQVPMRALVTLMMQARDSVEEARVV